MNGPHLKEGDLIQEIARWPTLLRVLDALREFRMLTERIEAFGGPTPSKGTAPAKLDALREFRMLTERIEAFGLATAKAAYQYGVHGNGTYQDAVRAGLVALRGESDDSR